MPVPTATSEVLKAFEVCGMRVTVKSQKMEDTRCFAKDPHSYEEVVVFEIWGKGNRYTECEVRFHERYTGQGTSKETKWEIGQTYLRDDTLGDDIERYDTAEEAVARRAIEIYLMTVVSQQMEIRMDDPSDDHFTAYLDGQPIGILEYDETAENDILGATWEGRLTEALGGFECSYTVSAATRDGACAQLLMERFTFQELLAKYDSSKDPALYQKLNITI